MGFRAKIFRLTSPVPHHVQLIGGNVKKQTCYMNNYPQKHA